MDLRDVDLNLLPVLDAVLRHRSASLAARELDMSQSALSAALGRLRALLGDPLFVRTGRGLLPTARAAALAEPVAQILGRVRDELLHGSSFDPTRADREFRLCLSDVGSYVQWPRIVRAVRAAAPGVPLVLKAYGADDIPRALEQGAVDLAIGSYPRLPESLFQRRLFERGYVGLVRVGHPMSRRAPSLRQFAQAQHVVVRMASGIQDRIDERLATQGMSRGRTIELPSYLMAPPLLEAGDFVLVLPEQLADAFAMHGRLAKVRLPFMLPASTIRMHWHRCTHEDAANAWLRSVVVGTLAD